MKRVFKYMVIAALMFIAFTTTAYADAAHHLTLKAYNCNKLDANWEQCVDDSGSPMPMTEIADNGMVHAGDFIRMDVWYQPSTTYPPLTMVIAYTYNHELVEPFDEGDIYTLPVTTTNDGGIYPAEGPRPNQLHSSKWSITANNMTSTHQVRFLIEDSTMSKPIEETGVLVTMFFTVKEDATAGELLEFNFVQGVTSIAGDAGAGTIQSTGKTLQIYQQLDSDTTLSALAVKNGTTNYPLTPTFSSSTKSYTAYVPNAIENATIEATATKGTSTVTLPGVQVLNVGANNASVGVEAQDGSTDTYTVNIYRLSNDDTLKSLSLSGVNIGTFSPSTTTYNATVPYTTSSTSVTAAANYSQATVAGTGNKSLSVGANEIKVEVSPEYCKSQYSSVPGNPTCEKKTYTINVTREAASTDATLSDLKVDGTTVTGFDPDTLTYTLPAAAKTKTSITIAATAADTNATITGTGNKTLNYGENSFDVVVTAQDGTTKKTYTINIEREAPSTNANLSDLKVDGTTVTGFAADTLTYTLDPVASDKTSITIAATAENSNATITGTGSKTLSYGNNSFDIVVTADDGTTKKTYTINVERPKKNNANLSDLKVDGTTVTGFSADTLTYTLPAAAKTKTSITIAATAADSDATITGTGNKNLNYGSNSFDVVVTAHDGTTKKTYTINIEREAPANSADLSDLKVDGTTVTGFSADTLTYTLDDVENSKTSINITATPADSNATVTGTGTKSLTVGNNSFPIVVTAEDGTTKKTYTINIKRNDVSVSSNADLSDLKVDGTTVSGFNKDTLSYTLANASSDKSSITIAATAEDSNATVTGTGSKSLTVGLNTFDVVVTAEDGTTKKTYKINITKEADTNNNLSSLSVDGYTLSPAFDKDTTNYSLEIPGDVSSIKVNATAESDSATVTGTGTISIPESKTITVKVKAESGAEKEYNIVVTKGSTAPAEITSVEYGHTIADGMIKSVALGTKPNTLKDQLDNDNEYLQIWDKDSSAQVSNDTNLGTGMIVKLVISGDLKDSKYVVVKGDVDGNGAIALLDAVKIINVYLENETLEGVYAEAGDYDSNGSIALLDAVSVLNVYLND